MQDKPDNVHWPETIIPLFIQHTNGLCHQWLDSGMSTHVVDRSGYLICCQCVSVSAHGLFSVSGTAFGFILCRCVCMHIVAICQYVDILQCQRYRCCPFLTTYTWMKLILPRLESIIGQKRYFSSCLAKPGTGLIASKYWLVFKLIANWPGSAVKLQPCFIAGIVAISHSLSNLQQWHRGQTTFCQ